MHLGATRVQNIDCESGMLSTKVPGRLVDKRSTSGGVERVPEGHHRDVRRIAPRKIVVKLIGRLASQGQSNTRGIGARHTPIIRHMHRLTQAIRQLRRNPAFALAVVASLALGIGANAAMFTLADAVLLRRLPIQDPGRLIRIASDAGPNGAPGAIPQPVADLISRDDLFDGVCGFLAPLSTIRINGRITQMGAHSMSGACFRTLGVGTVIGRPFTEADDKPGAPKVVVLAHDTWQREFGSDPSVIGKAIEIDGIPFTVIAVAEPRFHGLLVGYPEKLFFPFSQQRPADATAMPVSTIPVDVFARLRPGITLKQARAHLTTMWPRLLAATVPPQYGPVPRDRYLKRRLVVADAATGIDYSLRSRFRTPLLALLAISLTVLLVTSVNVANLLLARAAERRGELAVRAALGAPRSSLVYDVLTESVLLLAGGAIAGLVVSYWTDHVLVSIFTASAPTFALDITPNGRILAFMAAVSAIAFALFAVLPALAVSRTDPSTLHSVSSRVIGSRDRLRQATIVVQVALTIVLVAIGTTFVNQLRALRSEPLGLNIEGVLSAHLTPSPNGYDPPFSGGVYFRNLAESLRAIPGANAVALARPRVLSGFPIMMAAGDADRPTGETPVEQWVVSDGFFAALGIPLVDGSGFDHQAQPTDSRRTAIVSQSAAITLFGTTAVIGRHVRIGSDPQSQSLEIVGVAGNAVLSSPQLRNTRAVYLNYWQWGILQQGWADLLVRTDSNPETATDAIRRTVEGPGHEFVARAWTLLEQRDQALSQENLLAALSTAFAVLGLTLAIVGLYGLLAYSVAQRRSEIAIRMALGADAANVGWLVVRNALFLVGVGIAVGLPLSWAANRAASAALYGGRASVEAPVLAATVAMLVAAVVAAYRPARTAARLDPMLALRNE